VVLRSLYVEDHHKDTLFYSKKIKASILSFKNAYNGDLDLGTVTLNELKFYLTTYKGERDDNLFVLLTKFEKDNKTESSKPFTLNADNVIFNDSKVRIKDENLNNPILFDFVDVDLDATDFSILDSDIKSVINKLSFKDTRGMEVSNISTVFSYNLQEMHFENLDLLTEDSHIFGNVIFDYSEKGLANFNNNVIIHADFNKSIISTKDLNGFYDEFAKNETLTLTGIFNGTLNDFTFSNVDIRSGRTRINGTYIAKDLLSKDSNFSITGENHSIITNYFDLKRFMPRVLNGLPKELIGLGTFTTNGTSTVTESTLVSDIRIESSIGSVQTIFEMGNMRNIDEATYQGFIAMEDFNLGVMFNSKSIGNTTASLDFDGKGFTVETVKTLIEGTIPSFSFEGYSYKNITVSGSLENPVFNGSLLIDDPNLKMNFRGLIDVSKEINQYDFESQVDYAELNKLNLIKRDSISIFTGTILMKMQGTNVDNATGTIEFKETIYQNLNDNYYFDDFKIKSTIKDSLRTIEINSPDIINGKITGNFIIRDLPNLFRNGVGSIYTNFIPKAVTTDQYLDYDFVVHSKIVDIFVPQIKIGEDSRVRGSVASNESKFKLNFKSPEILVYDNYLGNVSIQVDNDNPLFNTYAEIDSVDTGFYTIRDLSFINVTLNDTLFIRSKFKGGKLKNDLYNLSLYHTINEDGKSVVGVKRSDITFKENVWFLNETNNNLNKIVFDNNFKDVRIKDLVLSHNNERIKMEGVLRDSTYKDIKLQFKDVDINKITPEVDDIQLAGNVNGNLNFLQKDGAYFPESNITIGDMSVNKFNYGDLEISVTGNNDLTKYDVDLKLENDSFASIRAVGDIDVTAKQPTIDLDVNLDRFHLGAFSAIGGDVITNIRGNASGNFSVTGNYKSPDLSGKITLDNSGLSIPYLNIDYALENNSDIIVAKNRFSLGNILLTDTKHNSTGNLTGFVGHKNFSDWDLNLNIAANNLLVLDTPASEDALYYGTAFISGIADIVGPVNELVINVNATTEENTVFKIPLSDTEFFGEDSFIRFISPEEKAARISGQTIVAEDIKGLTLNFELDITEKAEIEVVIDQTSGSTLNGRGHGTLLIEINTLGKFNMWGDFIVNEGTYDFRYKNLVQKVFEVEKGGTITWDRIPSRAVLNLKTKYSTKANPSLLLDDPSINRDIPVDVVINLEGEILKPNLEFNIEFPDAGSTLRSELEYRLQNKQQREQQAIYLLAIGSFQNDIGNIAASGALGNISERLFGMLNELFEGEDKKFKVALGYNFASDSPSNIDTYDTFEVSLSTKISKKVSISGTVGVPVGSASETAIAGDVEVQWILNEDGTLSMKFFNRQAALQFLGEQQNYEQGLGLSYTVDFDTFNELMKKIFKRDLSKKEEKGNKEQKETVTEEGNNNYRINLDDDEDGGN